MKNYIAAACFTLASICFFVAAFFVKPYIAFIYALAGVLFLIAAVKIILEGRKKNKKD